jgi:hypothetical protein
LYYGMALACIVLFGGMGIGSAYLFLQTLTVYEADDAEIIERSVFGMRRMRWRDVSQLNEGSGTNDSEIVLADNGGQKLTIRFRNLEKFGEGLRALILERLEALRARQTEDFGAHERTLAVAPHRMLLLFVCIGCVLLAAFFAVYFLAHDPTLRIPFGALGVCGAVMLLLTACIRMRRITFSRQEVRESWIWSEKRLPLHQVESVFLYQTSTQNGSFEMITLRGNGKRMQFASTMPDYPLLRAVLLKNVPPEAIQNGESDRVAYERLQNRVVLGILAVGCVYFVGMGISLLSSGVQKIERIERLAKQGVYTTARVTGKDCGCGNTYLKEVTYAFTVNGKTYTGDNLLSYSWARIRTNDTVPVCYLPQDPAENRLKALMDWHYLLLPLCVMLSLCFATPFLAYYLWKKKRRQRASKLPAA